MSLRANSVNVSTLCQLGTKSGKRDRVQKVLLLHLSEGLWGMELDWVGVYEVKVSENKKMRQSEEMLKLKKKHRQQDRTQ